MPHNLHRKDEKLMCQKFRPLPATREVAYLIDRATIEHLRHAGFAIVPLRPTEDMIAVGAPSCFIVPNGSVQMARRDAEECYRAMVELGCL